MSFGSLRYSQINRAFLSSYKGLYEASVVTIGSIGEPIYPYFDQTTLTNYLTEYIQENVGKFTQNYELNVDFYLSDGVTKCGKNAFARNVKINLQAEINFMFSYSKEQSFSIKDKDTI